MDKQHQMQLVQEEMGVLPEKKRVRLNSDKRFVFLQRIKGSLKGVIAWSIYVHSTFACNKQVLQE